MRNPSNVHRASTVSRCALLVILTTGCELFASPPYTVDAGSDDSESTGPGDNPDRCPASDCGGNSPVVNGFPIDGLHADGSANAEGFSLVRSSVVGGRCGGGSLDVDDESDELIVRGPDDGVRCRGAEVEGITFAVAFDGRPRRLAIALAERYESTTAPGVLRWKYKLVAADGDRPAPVSLCDRDEAAAWRGAWHSASPPAAATRTAASTGAAADTSDLIAFRAERYDEGAHASAWPRPGFFHLACARDSLAKLDLDGIAPHRGDPDEDYARRRAAALKMMTANFCDQARYTTDGRELVRAPYAACTYLGIFVPARCGIQRVEAVWDERGAACVSSTRLMRSHRKSVRASLFPRCHGADGRERECRTEQELVSAFHELCTGLLHRRVTTCAPNAYPGGQFVTGIVP